MVNVCNNFGLASAGGVFGKVTDAGVDIFRGSGLGPLTKWIDDHVFFRFPSGHLASYNKQRARWHNEILAHGTCRQEGGRLWYRGKPLPNGLAEEFDKDCSAKLLNLANVSPQAQEEQRFSYAECYVSTRRQPDLGGALSDCHLLSVVGVSPKVFSQCLIRDGTLQHVSSKTATLQPVRSCKQYQQ